MELIADQFNSGTVRNHPDGFSWLVKNRADFGSAQTTKLLEGFFARTVLLSLAGVDSLVFVRLS